jgi:hypothetical protein
VKALWGLAFLALVLVPLAAGRAGDVPLGSSMLVDGPQAGVDLFVGKSGTASILDRTADLRVVAADDDCDEPHAHGTIDGKDEPVGGCGWGRVLPLVKATPLMKAAANTITEEERAIASLGKTDQKAHWELALYGQLGLEHALEALDAAEKAGQAAPTTADKIRTRLKAAHAIDAKVKKQLQANPHPGPAERQTYIRELRNALSLKRGALEVIDHAGLKVAEGGSAPTPCGQARLDCVVSAFWDVNVPKRVKSALCVATNSATGRRTDAQHPLFSGVKQTQRCVVTNRIRLVHGERKRVVRLTITLTGTLAGKAKPVRVAVYWPA